MADEEERRVHVARRLSNSMDQPLTAPGSEGLARLALSQLSDTDLVSVLDQFTSKVLETLGDGQRHDTLAVPPGGGVAMWFRAWPGMHGEVQPQRLGLYLNELYGQARWLADRSILLTGFLEIDAYVAEWANPPRPLKNRLALEVEYSYLPGALIGGASADDPRWNAVVLNPDLCSAEERQALLKFMT